MLYSASEQALALIPSPHALPETEEHETTFRLIESLYCGHRTESEMDNKNVTL